MLFLRTLGGLALENDRAVAGAGAQRGRLAILAVLAVAGDAGVSRDRLLGLLWTDRDEERARAALNQALYALRRDVGEQELTLGTTELRLNPKVVTSDVAAFDAALRDGNLEEAVASYGGPFLDAIYIRNAPELERWIDRERDRLARAHRAALDQLADGARERADPKSAVEWLHKLAAVDPLSSNVARSLMEALVAAGDREAAIRHAAAYTALIRSELECEPDSSVVDFAEQLRSVKPNGHAASPSQSAAAPVVQRVVSEPIPPTPTRPPVETSFGNRPRVRLRHLLGAAIVLLVAELQSLFGLVDERIGRGW